MNKKIKNIFIFSLVFFGFLLANSCMDGLIDTPIDDEMEFTHTYAMPFVEGTYSLDKAPTPILEIYDSITLYLPIDSLLIDTTISYEFGVADTMDASLKRTFDDINEAILYFSYTNGFPFDCLFEAILYDSQGDVNVDTIISMPILASDVVDGVVQFEEGLDSVVMDNDFYSNTELADQIIISSIYTAYIDFLDAPDDLSDFSLEFHIGMQAEVTLK